MADLNFDLDPYRRTACLACRERDGLETILDLGALYLSDFPNSAGTQAHPPVPLALAHCLTCGTVQLTHSAPRDWIYKSQYWYRSGVNEAMVLELRDVVREAVKRVDLPAGSVVMDIGANDGTLLQQYLASGAPTKLLRVGYEPAPNLYASLRPHAQVVCPGYFEKESVGDRGARIITAIAMFYDLDDPHTFLARITQALHPDGVFVVQQAYLLSMLIQTAFDNICHEHLAYHSLSSMELLLRAHGLQVFDMDLRAINGGSFRVYVGVAGKRPVSDKVANFRKIEQDFFAAPGDPYADFVQRIDRARTQLHAALEPYTLESGHVVDLYGASTKGNTLLQAWGLDARRIRQAWERSPEKIGRYVGVSGIPIVSETEGRGDPPSALLSTIWQFRDGVLNREAQYLRKGGRIIFPLPAVEIVEGVA